MTHLVVVSQRAKDDLRHYYAVAAQHAPRTAALWLGRFEEALQSLSTNPTRCPRAPEADLVEQPVYQFVFGRRSARYRVLFTLDEKRVIVLHIRRGSMDKADASDLLS